MFHPRAILLLSAMMLLLAFGLPAMVSAAPGVQCAEAPCSFAVSGGRAFDLRLRELEIRCHKAAGSGKFRTENLGMTRIGFVGCREQETPFAFSCLGRPGSSNTIGTNALGSSTLEEDGIHGLLLSGARFSFVCGGFRRVHVEGFFVAKLNPQQCHVTGRRYPVRMELIAHGAEGAGATYDVFIDGYGGEQYEFDTSWQLKFKREATIRC